MITLCADELLADELENWDRSPRFRREAGVDEGDSNNFVKCKQHHAKVSLSSGQW